MKPSEYFARNVMVGASCMPRREAEMRYEIGIENLAWGSDYPHPEGSWPVTRSQMRDTFLDLPEDEITRILGSNLADFYGFETEKLNLLAAQIGPAKTEFRS